MSPFRPCAVVPTHRHYRALPGILQALEAAGLPAIVVDDGSPAEEAQQIAVACADGNRAELLRYGCNGGKGFAVICGLVRARERGFTHALQMDADGQHDTGRIADLLADAEQRPDAIITGVPRYDGTIATGRRVARWITRLWVAINSLSWRMPDAMCGFRVYPLDPTLALIREAPVRGRRMDFDVEILVKAHWAAIPLRSRTVPVTYPPGNLSNFQLLRDNLLLSALQTRLFFGMLRRVPDLLTRGSEAASVEPGTSRHWASLEERGLYAGMRLLALVYRLAGRGICLAAAFPVVLYFYATGTPQRRASHDYLMRLWAGGALPQRPGHLQSLRHFMAFAGAAVDKFGAWTGAIGMDRIDGIRGGAFEAAKQRGGAVVLTAHLGNPEILRAIADLTGRWRVNVLVHTVHAERFNRLLKRFSPDMSVHMMEVSEVGVDTAIRLSQAVERGEWVVMVADRVPVSEGGRVVEAEFLGRPAVFPQGPFILASILKCPVYTMFCLPRGRRFQVHFALLADRLTLPRRARAGAIAAYAAGFAERLEERVREAPYQWFNFYDFWPTARLQRGADGSAPAARLAAPARPAE